MPLDPETGARFRINTKQTTKDLWTIDATIEYKSDKITRSLNPDDPADVIVESLGARLWSLIHEAVKEGHKEGKIFPQDLPKPEPKKEAKAKKPAEPKEEEKKPVTPKKTPAKKTERPPVKLPELAPYGASTELLQD